MAVPVDLTLNAMVVEAYKRVGIKTLLSIYQKSRAEDYYLQEIFNDLWTKAEIRGNTRFRSLQTLEAQITTIGQSKYDFASDFDEEIDISILDGNHRDTAQSGGNTTITLAPDEDAGEADVVGEHILITANTGANGLRQAVAYNTTSKQATIDRAWDTNPDATSAYLIVKQITELDLDNIKSLGSLGVNTSVGKPSSYARIVEGANNRFILDKPPDLATYGLLIRYYTNLHQVNLTEGATTLITKLYNNWRGVLILGIAWKIANGEKDNREKGLYAAYEAMAMGLLDKELPYNPDVFQGFEL